MHLVIEQMDDFFAELDDQCYPIFLHLYRFFDVFLALFLIIYPNITNFEQTMWSKVNGLSFNGAD